MFYPVVLCVWRWEWGTVLFATAQQFQFPQCTMNCVYIYKKNCVVNITSNSRYENFSHFSVICLMHFPVVSGVVQWFMNQLFSSRVAIFITSK